MNSTAATVALLRSTADLLERLDAEQPLPEVYVTSYGVQVVIDAAPEAERCAAVVRINHALGHLRHVVDGSRHFVADGYGDFYAYTPLDENPADAALVAALAPSGQPTTPEVAA